MKGILLDDNFELSEFIKLNDCSVEEWTVYLLEDALFLTGTGLSQSNFHLSDYSLEGSELFCNGKSLQVQEVRKPKSLLDLIKLEKSSEELPDTLYFISRGSELPADFIIKSFKLSIDRIYYTHISLKDNLCCLLKVEKPSVFLSQLCREDWGIEQYYLRNNQLIPLGFKHPLAEYLQMNRGWRIYDQASESINIPLPEWQDIYKSLQINVDFNLEEKKVENSSPLAVNVPVSIVPGQRDEAPELWVLEEKQSEKLEKLISQASEDEIDNFYIASVLSGGQKYFLIRSRNFNKASLEFPGQALSRFSGFSNFMIPLSSTLNPPLRRDTYRTLFNLKSSLLTIVFSQQGKWKKLVVEEKTFEPLARFVNFIVEAEAEAVETMRAKVLFDPGIYLDAMPRPDLKIVRYEGGEQPVE